MLIEKEELCGLIPHAGDMCLLDTVVEWNDEYILCQTESHQLLTNPLRCDEGLSALQGLEYGMQAMAVHGGLLARKQGGVALPGFAAALKQVTLNVDWLHDIDVPIFVEAKPLVLDQSNFIYQFSLKANESELMQGRAIIMSQVRSEQ